MKLCKFIIITALACFGHNVHASDPAKALDWFVTNSSDASKFIFPKNFYLEIVEFYPNYIPLARIESQISDSDSGVTGKMLQLREIVKAGGREVRYQIWYQDESHWRLTENTTPPNPTSPNNDAGRDGDTLWHLTSNSLHVTDTKSLRHRGKWIDPNYLKDNTLRSLYEALFAISPPPTKYTPEPPIRQESSSGTFSLRTAHSSEAVDFINFSIQQLSDTYVIREMNVFRDPAAKKITVGVKSTFSDWAYNNTINHNVAHTRTLYDGDRVYCTYTISELRPLSESDQISKLVRLPSYNRKDPLRGELTFTVLMNHSDNEELIFSRPNDPTNGDNETRSVISKKRIRNTPDNEATLDNLGKTFIVITILFVLGLVIKKKTGTAS